MSELLASTAETADAGTRPWRGDTPHGARAGTGRGATSRRAAVHAGGEAAGRARRRSRLVLAGAALLGCVAIAGASARGCGFWDMSQEAGASAGRDPASDDASARAGGLGDMSQEAGEPAEPGPASGEASARASGLGDMSQGAGVSAAPGAADTEASARANGEVADTGAAEDGAQGHAGGGAAGAAEDGAQGHAGGGAPGAAEDGAQAGRGGTGSGGGASGGPGAEASARAGEGGQADAGETAAADGGAEAGESQWVTLEQADGEAAARRRRIAAQVRALTGELRVIACLLGHVPMGVGRRTVLSGSVVVASGGEVVRATIRAGEAPEVARACVEAELEKSRFAAGPQARMTVPVRLEIL